LKVRLMEERRRSRLSIWRRRDKVLRASPSYVSYDYLHEK
jgi:hypothetical protein